MRIETEPLPEVVSNADDRTVEEDEFAFSGGQGVMATREPDGCDASADFTATGEVAAVVGEAGGAATIVAAGETGVCRPNGAGVAAAAAPAGRTGFVAAPPAAASTTCVWLSAGLPAMSFTRRRISMVPHAFCGYQVTSPVCSALLVCTSLGPTRTVCQGAVGPRRYSIAMLSNLG